MPLQIESAASLNFADQLRSAREAAIRDGEAFEVVVYTIERLGSFLKGSIADLGTYEQELSALVGSQNEPESFTPFPLLFDLVREARNDALHQGAFARHLTIHAIELALRLEDALRQQLPAIVENYMVRNPTCAELWQPVSLIRQQMLANAFSFMPVETGRGQWSLLSDADLAKYLTENRSERKSVWLGN